MSDSRYGPYARGAASGGASAPVNRYYGKYRGKVWNNLDEEALGRIQVTCPAVTGLDLGWAMPCTPYAGPGVGFYAIPPIGANVWVEFEGGDPNYPIWSGCFWEVGETPNEPAVPEKKVWVTESITMILNDIEGEGGFTILVNPPVVEEPMSIVINATGITMTVPETVVKLTPENLEATVPESSLTMTAESITLTVPESVVTITAETISATVPPADLTLTAEAIELEIAPTSLTLSSEAVELEAPDISVTGATEFEGNVDVTGAVEITGDLEVLGAVEMNGPDIEMAAAAIEITGLVAVTGGMEVTGDILMDGQQVLVI